MKKIRIFLILLIILIKLSKPECTGSDCECALIQSNPTCSELTPKANYNCVEKTGDDTYACQETPKEKVDGCDGSDCECAFKGKNPTCSELTPKANYNCVEKTGDDTYACQETPKGNNEGGHTNNTNNSDTPINQTTKINSDTTASESEGVHMFKFSLIEFILLILF